MMTTAQDRIAELEQENKELRVELDKVQYDNNIARQQIETLTTTYNTIEAGLSYNKQFANNIQKLIDYFKTNDVKHKLYDDNNKYYKLLPDGNIDETDKEYIDSLSELQRESILYDRQREHQSICERNLVVERILAYGRTIRHTGDLPIYVDYKTFYLQDNCTAYLTTEQRNNILNRRSTHKVSTCTDQCINDDNTACTDPNKCSNRSRHLECVNCIHDDKCLNSAIGKKQFVDTYATIGKNNKLGVGLAIAQPVKQGQTIVEYVGNCITHEHYVELEKLYLHYNYTNLYALELDENVICDAQLMGNEARLANHACYEQATCTIRIFYVSNNIHSNKYSIHAALVANRDLPTNSNVTIDYGWTMGDIQTFVDSSFQNVQCECGGDRCRGWLFAVEQETIEELKAYRKERLAK